MSLASVADMDEFFRPILLMSLIIGMVVLIFLEKRKGGRQKMEEATQNAGDIMKITKDIKKEEEEEKEVVQERISTLSTPLQASSTTSTHFSTSSTHSSTSSSSSGSEEEATRPRKVLKRPKKKQCKGSPTICATKRKVTDVTVVTDSLEEKVQESLEELAEEIRSHGVTCTVHPAFTHLPPSISTEPSHLLLVFGTSIEGCRGLQGTLVTALGGDAALPPPQPFLYSVSCRSAAAAGDVFEAAQKLSGCLVSCGGAEWLPVTCITTEDKSELPVMGRQEFAQTVMEKLTKPAKKCCGTSCGSKTVDIEDLASSLLLPRTAVTS